MEAIKATRYVRRVRGGSQSHILECDDEYLCTRLARAIAISVPVLAIVEVDAEFIERNNKLRFMVNERTHTRKAFRWEPLVVLPLAASTRSRKECQCLAGRSIHP
jgi:hypothetical protein